MSNDDFKSGPPDYLNGCQVISKMLRDGNTWVVLLHQPYNTHEYITGIWRPALKTNWELGNYFKILKTARADLARRAKS